MYDRLNPTYVLAPHDDNSWVRATLLSQRRVDGAWRVTVSYLVDGDTYWRGMPAGECRPVDNALDGCGSV